MCGHHLASFYTIINHPIITTTDSIGAQKYISIGGQIVSIRTGLHQTGYNIPVYTYPRVQRGHFWEGEWVPRYFYSYPITLPIHNNKVILAIKKGRVGKAAVAKLVDASGLGSDGRNLVQVRLLSAVSIE
jgi:hypothetical protein